MTSPSRKAADAEDDRIEAFLRANPGWLAERPHLYRVLTPPQRVYGEHLADHMAAMIRAERSHANAMAARADGVLAAGRAAAGLQTRVQAAVVALLRSEDPADCVSFEIPGILAIDAAALCVEGHRAGARSLPPGAVAKLLDGRDVVFRTAPVDAPILHGEAAELARYDALARVPGTPAALIALVARDAVSLDPSQGAGALAFLGKAVAAALER